MATYYPQLTARPVQGTKHNRGEFPAAGNSLNEPWPGPYDQTVHKNRISDMFSETGGGLTTRKVPLFDVDRDGQPITAARAIAQAAPASTTTYFPPGPEYGYNAITGDYEVQQPGQPYAADGGRPNFEYPVSNQPQTEVSSATKQSIAAMFGGGWGAHQPLNWEPAAPAGSAPAGDPWAGTRIAAAPKPGLVTASRPAAPPPPTRARVVDQAYSTGLTTSSSITNPDIASMFARH